MANRALVVDDDEIARELLASILREAGYQVFELPSPIGATRVIAEKDIDVLVLDVFMPSMDGDKFAKLLRGNPKLNDLDIVLVSGASPEELAEVATRVKANAIVSKAHVRTSLVPAIRGARAARIP